MTKRMLIDASHPEETRVVLTTGSRIEEFDFATSTKKQHKGNIYLAKITRVEPSLQAAFVEYGEGRQGFLPFAEIHPDYYQIPVADRERLLAEETGEEPGEEAPPAEAPDSFSEEDAFPEAMPASEAYADTPLTIVEDEDMVRGESSTDTSEEWQVSGDAPIIAVPQDDFPEAAPPESSAEPAPDQDVETLADADEDAESRKRFRFLRRYRIQEVIKRGQIVLVQVLKEERGNKGASLTTYISLAGRYCVLMPNTLRSGGVSRKIANAEDRRRLKQVAERFELPKGMSIIIRTAGSDREPDEIYRDYEYLIRLWDKIREDTLASTAPAVVHEEGDLIKRSIRDLYQNSVEEIMVEGEPAYNNARDFMQTLMPNHVSKVKQYQNQVPLFHAYDVEDQLIGMTDPMVTLHSGAYIVINPTEALVSIDVNSGRATGERNIEETATKANIAAAHEIARQLRLRDLAGLIVIDFIDMNEQRNRRAVERTLKDALKQDRARIQLSRISAFGLLEMSRQRLRPSISELNMVACPHCEGSGLVRSTESMALHILRAIEKEASSSRRDQIVVTTTSRVASYMLNLKRESLEAVEERHDIRVFIEIDERVMHPGFRIETSHSSDGTYVLAEEKRFAKATEQDDSRGRRRRGRGRRGGDESSPRGRSDERGGREERGGRQRSFNEPEIVENEGERFGSEPVEAFGDAQPRREGRGEGRGRRNRRGRGGRRNQQDSLPASGAPEGEAFADIIDDMPLPVSVEGTGDASGFAAESEGGNAPGEERSGRRRGRRGGRDRNRRRWKDREGQPQPEGSSEGGSEGGNAPVSGFHEPVSANYAYDAPQEAAAPRLPREPRQPREQRQPREPREQREPRQREQVEAYHGGGQQEAYTAASPSSDEPSGPPRRGWWRRMLD